MDVGVDSLMSLTDADAHHAARGRAEWASASVDAREAALVRATDFVCSHYGRRWIGSRTDRNQSLCWPRSGIYHPDGSEYPTDVIPGAVKAAVAEVALEAIRGEISAGTVQRVIKSVSVGSLSVDYADQVAATGSSTTIDAILAPFLTSPSRSIRLERVW